MTKDNINPDHYKKGSVECIDAISSAVEGLVGVEAMLTGNAMKYLYRWKQKNGAEDLKKAKWYIDRLISELDRTADTSSGAGEHARLGNRESSAAPKSKPGPCRLHDTDWYPPHNVDEVIFVKPGLSD